MPTEADVLAVLEALKASARGVPGEAGALAVVGVELSELIVGFVAAEDRQRTIETLRSWLRSGGHTTVQKGLDELYPNG